MDEQPMAMGLHSVPDLTNNSDSYQNMFPDKTATWKREN